MTTLDYNFKSNFCSAGTLPYLAVEVVLYFMQEVIELVQTLAWHLTVECAIRANVCHSDISVHGIDLEYTQTRQGCWREEPTSYFSERLSQSN